jgi:hypothetical protein
VKIVQVIKEEKLNSRARREFKIKNVRELKI